MKTSLRTVLALLVASTFAAPTRAADDPAGSALKEKIVGTWKLASAKYNGQEFKFPDGVTTVKHVTPSQFMWASYDADGKVSRAAGGSYTLKGESYEEAPEYGLSADFDTIKGEKHAFTCRIDGNTWHHDGKLSNGLTIEEVWERVEKK
jgi:hypothetical protein